MFAKLTDQEKAELEKFHQELPKEVINVEPLFIDGVESFANSFFQRRGCKNPKFAEYGFFCFKNVGMHTDNQSPSNFGTLIVMVQGSGTLNYWDGKKCHHQRLISGEAFFFDFNLPHAFEARETCSALLIDVPKIYKKYLLK